MNKMNLPNKLTIFRMILIVPFVVILLGGRTGRDGIGGATDKIF